MRLALQPHRGNHQRAYPFTGHLGLTPVTLHGILRTEVEEDNLPLEASSVIVRAVCYEGDISGPGGASRGTRRLFEVARTLWEAPEGLDYAPLGDFEHAWHLTIPPNAREQGAVSTLSFKTWRVWWCVEAVVNHRPSGIFGRQLRRSHPLLLVQHALPRMPPKPPTIRGPADHDSLHVKAILSESILCLGDPFGVKLALRRRTHAASDMAIKRITVEIRRTIQRRPLPLSDSASELRSSIDSDIDTPPTPSFDEQHSSPASSPLCTTPDAAFLPSYFPHSGKSSPLPPVRLHEEETTLMSLIVEGEQVAFGSDGCWSTALTADMPRTKSLYHYSLGETIDVPALTIKCFVHVKVSFRGKTSAPIELPPAELTLAPMSAAERATARQKVAKIAMVQEAERKLFEPRANGTCRATESSRFASAVSPNRRHSDQDSPERRSARPRFNSTVEAMGGEHFVVPIPLRTSSTGDATSGASAQVGTVRPVSRGRFLSVDEQAMRPPISPIVEVDATPRMAFSNATPLIPVDARPFTPPSDDDPSPPASELFKSFATFSLGNTSTPELSPPPSPAAAKSRLRARDVGPRDQTPSPKLRQPSSLSPPPALVVTRAQSDEVTGQHARRRSSGGLARLFGRRSSRCQT